MPKKMIKSGTGHYPACICGLCLEGRINNLKRQLAEAKKETKVSNLAGSKLCEEAARLREALELYGWHRSGCPVPLDKSCSCGYTKALADDGRAGEKSDEM